MWAAFVSPPAVSVIEHMLLLDPEKRVTAAEALTLPYFTEFKDSEEEKEAQPYDHSLDNAELTLEQWKRKDGQTQQAFHTDVVLMKAPPSFSAGHTFTEILTFKPILPDAKETSL